MKLSDLLKYKEIVIQCHDNPDPDSIGAGYALYTFFKSKGKKVRLVYSGQLIITKPNIVMLVEQLNIPIEYVKSLKVDGLLITVDCQYGAGNVTKLECDNIAIIDHHIQEGSTVKYQEIRTNLASTCTLIWDLFNEEGFDVNKYLDVSTALYYGLFTDSSAFVEVHNALDKDMRDSLYYDPQLLRRLRNSILTLRELEIAGMALIRHSYNVANKCVMVKAQECDPNILGLISDFALQVDCVNVCIVYNEAIDGIKFSVRSCVKEVMANELAAYLAGELGNGGGHMDRAAGFISKAKFNMQYPFLNYDEYFLRRLTEYYQSFEVINSIDVELNKGPMKRYQKIPRPMGVVRLGDILPEGSSVVIRSSEKDIERFIRKEDCLLIDEEGCILLIDEAYLNENYCMVEGEFKIQTSYFPRIRRQRSDKVIYLKEYTKGCMIKGENIILARQLDKAVKIFMENSPEQYKYGKIGDYVALSEKNPSELYIIEKNIFDKSYREI